ncbi:MAG TPA: hypothetical protein DDY13_09755 [Cytophagales bacterium]|jgi:uncharacterized membrane-anchored protein YhcB (DUF1043 family)|nr:hypothetical protein [Cytophagales bacterium]
MTFLEKVTSYVLKHYQGQTPQLCVVFPNKRAGLFFKKQLSKATIRPIWAPQVLNIREFIQAHTVLNPADRLILIYELYRVFKEYQKSKESFDSFFYWGETLLKDFDDLDKFMVDHRVLFRNLAQIKDLDQLFDYLDEAQKELIKSFWASFGEKLSKHQQDYLQLWNHLPDIYENYQAVLQEKNIGYEGLIHRQVASSLNDANFKSPFKNVIFAGFNALSVAEEKIISWYISEKKARILWDADKYYLEDDKQEAGRFLRELRNKPVLRPGFESEEFENSFKKPKSVQVHSAPLDTGQIQVLAQLLKKEGVLDERTAIVLPDERLLIPLLHALPDRLENSNITMGYPVRASQSYSFIENLLEVHMQKKQQGNKTLFYHRSLSALLSHPFIYSRLYDKVHEILKKVGDLNLVFVEVSEWIKDSPFLQLLLIFPDRQDAVIETMQEILKFCVDPEEEQSLESEFIFQFISLLNQLKDFLNQSEINLDNKAFLKLFRQLTHGLRLPFEGEPLRGLQIMGLLETRNLDFDNVYLLSANEGLLPPSNTQVSFVPYNLRKAYGMNTMEHLDAIYAYLFYRLVQRAENVHIIHNNIDTNTKKGEVSRFVQQLEWESQFSFSRKTYTNQVALPAAHKITIPKNERVMERLWRYTSKVENPKTLSPSALNTYLDCPLRFYFRYVINLYEQEKVEEDIDARVLGNLLHLTMEYLYMPYVEKPSASITKVDFQNLKKELPKAIDQAFEKHFHIGKEDKIAYAGQNVLAHSVIEKMAKQVLEEDEKYAPFNILGIEVGPKKGYELSIRLFEKTKNNINVRIGGIIDRIDQKDGTVRILDYKTGSDNKDFDSIEGLFDPENKNRNKAAMQTFLYGLIFRNKPGDDYNTLFAGLYNIKELYSHNFDVRLKHKRGRHDWNYVDNMLPYFPAFEQSLQQFLEKIFDPDGTFPQTDDQDKCTYCPYSGICNR